jgi:uncharacterized protein YcbK (DUF882 family)
LPFFLFFNNISLVEPDTQGYYRLLKKTLKERDYHARLLVVSTKRLKWQNDLLVKYNNASSTSRHMKSQAIDFIVFDVNDDGKSNKDDVKIVYDILDKEIIANKGGIGRYLKDNNFFNRQMIHIDCRGYYKRW